MSSSYSSRFTDSGASPQCTLENEKENSSESSSSSHSEVRSSDEDKGSIRYLVFFLHLIRFLVLFIFFN